MQKSLSACKGKHFTEEKWAGGRKEMQVLTDQGYAYHGRDLKKWL